MIILVMLITCWNIFELLLNGLNLLQNWLWPVGCNFGDDLSALSSMT